MIRIQADTINGISTVDYHDEKTVMMDEELFYSSLSDLSDGDVIGSEVSIGMYRKLHAEYGINAI